MEGTVAFDMDTFDMAVAKRGQEVTEEVYNHFLNCMPPIGLRECQGYSAGFQVGEPYQHRTDLRTGRWRGMYATFTSGNGKYFYQGINFPGEINSTAYVEPKEDLLY